MTCTQRTVLVWVVLMLVARGASAQLRDVHETSLTAADGARFDVTEGIVRVPELRADREGTPRTIDLAVVRLRRQPSAGRSAHVVLAGGPGDSGVGLVLNLARQGGAAIADMMDGDVIGIDQRGTGRSVPTLESRVLYNLPLDRPGSLDAWLPLVERTVKSVAEEFTRNGVRLNAYNTSESADDVDAVRRAFGYTTVTLWGRSYGSHLALATLRRHPDAISRVVLINPEGPDHTWKLPSLVDRSLQLVAERAQVPDLVTMVRQVIDRLTKSPVVVPVTNPQTGQTASVTIGGFDLQWVTADALGDARTIATLPAAYRQMAAGDFSAIAPYVLLRRSRLGVESAMKHMMDSSSGATRERRSRIEREGVSAVLGNAINFPGMYVAGAWSASDLGDSFRQPVSSAVPTLILAGDLDPRTPVENGREILATLSNGHLVIVENASHQFDVFGSPAVRSLLGRFLEGLPIPENRLTLPPIVFRR